MQSFASPIPSPSPSPTIPTPPTKKGATIAYTHALSTQKSTERAQLSPIPTPFPPKNQ